MISFCAFNQLVLWHVDVCDCLCVAWPLSLRGAPSASPEVKDIPGLSHSQPDHHIRTKIPRRFPEKLTGRITAKDSRQTTVMSRMMWRWKDRYVTASMPHLLRISSSLHKQRDSRERGDALRGQHQACHTR